MYRIEGLITFFRFVEIANAVFVCLFTAEIVFRLVCFGPRRYCRSLFNRLDCVLVVISVADCVLVYSGVMPEIGLSALRTARLMRIFKATDHWLGLRNLSLSLMNSLRSITSLLFLLFLFVFIFSLLGMQLFGGKFNINAHEIPVRQNFDSFWQSLLTVFQASILF